MSPEYYASVTDQSMMDNAFLLRTDKMTTKEEEILDEEIEKLIEERQAARKNKDFARADEIRDQLLEQGIVLKDSREGVKWSRA